MTCTTSYWSRFVLVAALVVIKVLVLATLSRGQDEQANIQLFARRCTSPVATVSGEPFVEARFAPIRELRSGERPRYGTWGYAYETSDQQYPGNEFVLRHNGNPARIHFVSTMRRPTSANNLPPYLWHVISTPTPNDSRAGFVARHEEFSQREGNVWGEDYDYLLFSNVEGDEENDQGFLLYVDRGLGEDLIADIRRIWIATFDRAMTRLVLPSHGLTTNLYTHTFVYVDAARDVADINGNVGDRRNSSRRVTGTGTVYGFVLSANGSCLASASIEAK